MTAGEADEKSVIDDVFSKSSDMGADTAAPAPSPEAPAPVAEAKEEPAPQEIVKAEEVSDEDGSLQGRDPKTGRFVPVTELVSERKKLKGERDNEAKLRAEAEANAKAYREQVETLQRQLMQVQRPAQPQPQEQQEAPPDPYLEPEKFAQYQQSLINQQLINQHVNTSELLARQKHGDGVVDAALQAAYQAGIADRFVQTRHPFDALVEWHKRQLVNAEIGNDFEGFKKRVADEAVQKALAGLKAQGMPAPAQAQAPQRFPTTLADQTQTGDQGALLTPRAAADSVFAHRRSA